MNSWVLVADSAQARIFNAETEKSALSEITNMNNIEGRMHERELTSDLPGRQTGGAKDSHHSLGGKSDAKEHEEIEFAKELCKYLEEAHNTQKFGQLVVVAAPHFLGQLRKEMNDNVAKLITLEIDKDIVKQDADEIRSHLPTYLPHL